MTNILLIENQETQFQSIYDRFLKDDLSCTYKIFPANSQFVEFIDYVRVWVNVNYSTYLKEKLNESKSNDNLSYRELAMKKIIKTITDNDIDILLMDYKLGAGYLSKTGIDLATAINELLEQSNSIPVVFISKDQKNEKIEKEFQLYKWKKGWIYKGFFGDEILQSKYINDYVINGKEGIVSLLSNSKKTPEHISIPKDSIM